VVFWKPKTSPIWIDPETTAADPFPDVKYALKTPNGLLAMGGNLEPPLLLTAYRRGLFPWFSPGECIHWWSPDPRMVLFPERLRVSRSLRRAVRRETFSVEFDRDFRAVIEACAQPRNDGEGTWIGPEMITAYCRLHELGSAHSVEARRDGRLAGGLYGVTLGRCFFGESMFSRDTDASKVCLVHLVEKLIAWNYELIDCQMQTAHLQSLGAEPFPRKRFLPLLERSCALPPAENAWR